MSDLLKKELHVVIHGQTPRFRIIKYIVLFVFATTLYIWKGIETTGKAFLILFIASLCIHFFFRYKTDGWTKSWWLYKHKPFEIQ